MTDTPATNRALDRLEREIRQLQIEQSRFLAGDIDQPPRALREELETRIANLRSSPQRSTAERFRLSSLAAKLRSYNELFDRRSRDQRNRHQIRSKPVESVVAGRERGGRAVRRLYSELYEGSDDETTTLGGFRQFLDTKVEEIRGRTGCSSVQFRVISQDGKKTLKARPIGRGADRSKGR